MHSEIRSGPPQKRRQDQTPVAVPRGVLASALDCIKYEIGDLTLPVPNDERGERDPWKDPEILRKLYESEADLEHFLGNRLNDRVSVLSPYGPLEVDLRGYPAGTPPEQLKRITRVDLAEWRARKDGCPPHTIDLSDLDYWVTNKNSETELLIHHLTKDS